ncbi:epoxide hydrolase [Paenibacillus nanensis]|uniref:Epoxide hydrolase n=1 Tax=Paenibacillus nanensis TaxID=393251 RepID=A0A3A1ULU3_9BACL|nr:epoxide hydrolase family protein [Paenibacillus nanensis]RIX48724.1 epoxide hydrolase [Paenibacillus nanensis]
MTISYNSQYQPSGEIRPFRIRVPQEELDGLMERLDRSRLPELPDTGWERGVPLTYLAELQDYWRRSYDWRKHESKLNELPQYVTTIDGQNIHFLHIPSAEPNAIPLMLIHGWPGSFVEFLDVIEPLTAPSKGDREAGIPPFHLIIPSIPGFGYSIPLKEPGWTPARIAGAFLQLMDRLGYARFGVQGGDSGAFIAPEMGKQAPERVIGVHVNALLTFPSGEDGEFEGLTEEEQQRLARLESFNDGYLQIQSKSPQTLAYGLHDSPVGQLAWIAEIFKKWTHPEGELPEASIDRNRLLTNISLYWFTGTSGSSAQIYYESMNDPMAWAPKERGTVPTGVLVAKSHDTAIRRFAEREHRIIHWTERGDGGHFYAMEQPLRFAEDVQRFFKSVL